MWCKVFVARNSFNKEKVRQPIIELLYCTFQYFIEPYTADYLDNSQYFIYRRNSLAILETDISTDYRFQKSVIFYHLVCVMLQVIQIIKDFINILPFPNSPLLFLLKTFNNTMKQEILTAHKHSSVFAPTYSC